MTPKVSDWKNLSITNTVMKRCREFEKTLPLVPDSWIRCHQYAIDDSLMPALQNVWSFGISKECRMEEQIRRHNASTKIHTWDPTPISQSTIDKANNRLAKIIHTNKAYDPDNESLTFYTTDPTKRCYSLENFDPDNLVDSYTVSCINLKKIINELGSDVDLIKFDIEGRWYQMCNEILDIDLAVKQVVGEFEMYMGDTDEEFEKLDSIISRFESKGYKTYCNRLLAETNTGHIPNNPCVEIAFIKNG